MDEKENISDKEAPVEAAPVENPEAEISKDTNSEVTDSEKKSEDSASEVTETLDNHVEADSVDSAAAADVVEEPSKNDEQKDNSSVEEPSETQDNNEKVEEPKQNDVEVESEKKVDEISSIEESSQDAADSQTPDDAVETPKEETSTLDVSMESQPKDDDDKDTSTQKPEFETAQESTEETQEDHTQALDPFDALLKDTSSTSNAETSTQVDAATNADDDDDDFNVDAVGGDNADESTLDDSTVPELEPPGEDEEVCLLPDTEREISEADKAEAEKVLAEKRKQAEAEALLPKQEEDKQADEELQDPAETTDDAVDDAANDIDQSQENGEENAEDAADAQPNIIQEISAVESTCVQCKTETPCKYRFQKDKESQYLCSENCTKQFQNDHPSEYVVTNKKYLVTEIEPKMTECSECEETKLCYYYYNYDGEDTNYCSLTCVHSMMADEKSKYTIKYIGKKEVIEVDDPQVNECMVCHNNIECRFGLGVDKFICGVSCIKELNTKEHGRYNIKYKRGRKKKVVKQNPPLLKLKVMQHATDKYIDEAYKIKSKTPAMVEAAREERERTFIRTCSQCDSPVKEDDRSLTWETMDFCNEGCLGRYQNTIGGRCAYCKETVAHTSLGKYCVRFGYDIRQFCNGTCLEEFKKGLKICCYCQRDISVGHQGFLAPVGDKGQFKDFCTQACMEKFDQMSKNPVPQSVWAKCAVCSIEKATTFEVEVSENVHQRLCSDPCFAAFKFVNNFFPDQCRWCKKYFERTAQKCFTIYEGSTPHCFCSKSCINVYISNTRQIAPCNWCKVKKYNFDMIKRNSSQVMMCSLNCLNLYQVSLTAVSSRRIKCDMCKRVSQAQYHLTMSDATVRNFCTYQCVMAFQGQYSKLTPPLQPGESIDQQPKAVPTGAPRRTYTNTTHKNNAATTKTRGGMPVISNVQSLATPPPLTPAITRGKSKRNTQQTPIQIAEPIQAPKTPPPPPKPLTPPPPPPPKIYNHVLVKTLPPAQVSNKATMTKPMMVSKGVSCRPHPCTKECQTDPSLERRVLIPVPVPIYVPVPLAMWSIPFPVPVPIPIPIPTPVFIPTTRNSAKGIMKEISKIHDKMPTDPFEAELLMMAEMVAGDKKKDQSDSDTDDDNAEQGFSPVPGIDGNNAFGEDMLQMALKMASEYEDQPVDLESAMTANTITPSSHPGMPGLEGESMHHHHMMVLEQQRAVAALRASAAPRKRAPGNPPPPAATPARRSNKRRRPDPPPPDPPREPAEKPDANMCLKYTFGVNAWKQWVMTKNAEIEKSSIRRKPFKSEILQLTADELNFSLCLFVKEVRKPNGSEYAPDTIYYLVLGIQQYLFENGRIDNIFTDPYYEKFTDCLDEVARKFSVLYNDSQYIVTRVEEEHLWESKQLGAHSPHVLLSTLMFFNTKHFNLVTVDEHMQLSFSHIMKHWKRNPNQPGQAKMPGSRNVLLRFYPPQSALEANSRKKKVYEQQENEENPLRCPVKLYEFYISKCPESVRTRNDVFYLQPERSCVPDSPVWYSTQPLSRDALAKMLHRVKMVKEINIALLTS